MMRVLSGILQTLLGIFVALLSPLRRAICRRRKSSASDIAVPMQGDTHSTSIDMTQFQMAPPMQPEPEMASWDAWDSEESSVARGNHARVPEAEPEPEPDYFRDMVPEFQRAKKIKVRRKEEGAVSQSAISSRLAVQSSLPPQMSGELTAWEEGEDGGAWELEEEGLVDQAEAAVRDKRRQERQQRNQQRRRQEKTRQHAAPHLAAVKLS